MLADSTHRQNNMNSRMRILSIDGGGVRGIVAARILCEVERKIQEITGDVEARIADYFDLVAGTSAGGLIAASALVPDEKNLGRARYTVRDGLDHYLNYAGRIFRLPLTRRIRTVGGLSDEKYPTDGLLECLNVAFGDLWLSDLLRPCLIAAYNVERCETTFFTQHTAKERPSRDYRLVDVGRAATAAPTYFEVAMIASRTGVSSPYIDGGVFANNPAKCALTEASKYFNAQQRGVSLLSIGTGRARPGYSYDEMKDWGSVTWGRPLVDIMMAAGSETVDYECRLFMEQASVESAYLRIDADLGQLPTHTGADMDDASPTTLQALCELGERTCKHWQQPLERFLHKMLA